MAKIESKLQALGLVLPAPMQLPPGVVLPFPWVRVHGNPAFVSGHAAQNADGSLAAGTMNQSSTAANVMGGDTSQHVHGIYRDPANDYGAAITP